MSLLRSMMMSTMQGSGVVSLWTVLSDTEIDLTAPLWDPNGFEGSAPTYNSGTQEITLTSTTPAPALADGVKEQAAYGRRVGSLPTQPMDGIDLLIMRMTSSATGSTNQLAFMGTGLDVDRAAAFGYEKTSATNIQANSANINANTAKGSARVPPATLYASQLGEWTQTTNIQCSAIWWYDGATGGEDNQSFNGAPNPYLFISNGSDANGSSMSALTTRYEYFVIPDIDTGLAYTELTDSDLLNGATPDRDPGGEITGLTYSAPAGFSITTNAGDATERSVMDRMATWRIAMPAGWLGDGTQGIAVRIERLDTVSANQSDWYVGLGVCDNDGDPSIGGANAAGGGCSFGWNANPAQVAIIAMEASASSLSNSVGTGQDMWATFLPRGATGDNDTVGAWVGSWTAANVIREGPGGTIGSNGANWSAGSGTDKCRLLLLVGSRNISPIAADLKFRAYVALFTIPDLSEEVT